MNISYSQCWEDSLILLKALQIDNKDVVLSITSGGCNTLAIATSSPKCVYSIDSNDAQNYLLELKKCVLEHLDSESILPFLGYSESADRVQMYQNLLPFLDAKTKEYWNNHLDLIKNGIVHAGKFEHYLTLFRKFILPLVHTQKRIRMLVDPKIDRTYFYDHKWNTWRWRFLFRFFFSHSVMSGRGRSKKMFTYAAQETVATSYAKRVERFFKTDRVVHNFYLNYILFKESEQHPYYLENLDKINRYTLQSIQCVNQDLITFLRTMPERSISKFNLSDVFEPITQEEMDLIVDEIYRTATPNARLIFWNNLVHRDINSKKSHFFKQEMELENELKREDRIFFYERFYIYKVIKNEN